MFKSAHGHILSRLNDEELQLLVGELQEVLGEGAKVRVEYDQLMQGTWIDFAVVIPAPVDGVASDKFDEQRVRELAKRLAGPNGWRKGSGSLVFTDFGPAGVGTFPDISVIDFSQNGGDATVDIYGTYVDVDAESFLPYGARVEYD